MNNFRSGNRSGGRGDSYGGGGNYGGRDSRGGLQLHDAVCNQCGKDCQVPFRPSGNKPVYCSDCFEKQGG
ncbi:DNA-directed RNA polymerase, partial [Patescibacteria group bacterium]|nr:DNA-directed RNA polymerase [Patescibacteria group bacterium]